MDANMLKELVRERLIEAADEIFRFFESTILSYEEQLYQAKRENEHQRQQLEAFGNTQTVLRAQDILQTVDQSGYQKELTPKLELGTSNWDNYPDPCGVKEELQPLHVEDTQVFPIKEEKVSDMPPTGLLAQSKDEELLQLHPQNPSEDYSVNSPPNNLLTPSSNSVDTASLSNNKDSEGHEKRSLSKRQKHLTCSICGERFDKRQDLLLHKKRHFEERTFNCTLCGKAFKIKANLGFHMRKHNGDKPFKCTSCGVAFTRKYCLERHMRMHTGEQPFVCKYCGRKFAYQPTMIRHIRNHTGEKPFKCSTCGTAFSQKAHLHVHKKTCTLVSES
ncbi:uncharacterized protein LOC144201681 [Stigmatopora nigra]